MVFTESAKMVIPDEIRKIIDDNDMESVVINAQLFVETRAKEGVPGKVFPCYPIAWRTVQNGDDLEYEFQFQILQFHNGDFEFVLVKIKERELGVTKRIWDKPPTRGLRDSFPFVEEGVQ